MKKFAFGAVEDLCDYTTRLGEADIDVRFELRIAFTLHHQRRQRDQRLHQGGRPVCQVGLPQEGGPETRTPAAYLDRKKT